MNPLKALLLLVYVCVQVGCDLHRNWDNFHCKNGAYIMNEWFCNGNDDCGDNSDEEYGCEQMTCGEAMFTCTNGECLGIDVRCNSIDDCKDRSDEFHCGNETKVDDCLSQEGNYLCQDKLRCIDLRHTCDTYCNCFDCSDEEDGCLKYNDYICDTCSETCNSRTRDSRNSSISALENVGIQCQECMNTNTCDQICINIESIPIKDRCLCDENYEPQMSEKGTQVTCRSEVSYENVLIYSTANSIKLYNLTTNETFVIQSGIDCTALTAANQYIYYAIFMEDDGNIFKTEIQSKMKIHLVKYKSHIISLAVDWMTHNIYFTTDKSILACTGDGKLCEKLKSCTMCSVNVSPKFGWMFWNENNTIIKSSMDGLNDEIMIQNWMNITTDRSISYSVNDFKHHEKWLTVLKIFHEIREPKEYVISFTEFENTLFFATENQSVIHTVNVISSSVYVIVDDDMTAVKQVYAYNPLLQRTRVQNPCKISCPGLCLLRPSTTSIGLSNTCLVSNSLDLKSKNETSSYEDYQFSEEYGLFNSTTVKPTDQSSTENSPDFKSQTQTTESKNDTSLHEDYRFNEEYGLLNSTIVEPTDQSSTENSPDFKSQTKTTETTLYREDEYSKGTTDDPTPHVTVISSYVEEPPSDSSIILLIWEFGIFIIIGLLIGIMTLYMSIHYVTKWKPFMRRSGTYTFGSSSNSYICSENL